VNESGSSEETRILRAGSSAPSFASFRIPRSVPTINGTTFVLTTTPWDASWNDTSLAQPAGKRQPHEGILHKKWDSDETEGRSGRPFYRSAVSICQATVIPTPRRANRQDKSNRRRPCHSSACGRSCRSEFRSKAPVFHLHYGSVCEPGTHCGAAYKHDHFPGGSHEGR
jgi:hypothetical protein